MDIPRIYHVYTCSFEEFVVLSALGPTVQDLLTTAPVSAKSNSRRKSNSDGLLLTKSGRVSMSSNEVNAKYDASYRNSDNNNKLLGRSLSLGQACGIIGVVL